MASNESCTGCTHCNVYCNSLFARRIIISSATLEAKKFQKYFDTTDEEPVEGGEGHGVGPVVTPYGPLMHKPVILEVTGRTHPVGTC